MRDNRFIEWVWAVAIALPHSGVVRKSIRPGDEFGHFVTPHGRVGCARISWHCCNQALCNHGIHGFNPFITGHRFIGFERRPTFHPAIGNHDLGLLKQRGVGRQISEVNPLVDLQLTGQRHL